MLCRAVRSRTFFSIAGKYSVRCVVMSSLGGRWPKKLRSFEGRFAFCAAGLNEPDVGEGGSSAFSGSRTPRPLSMLMELARFVLLLVCPGLRNLLWAGDVLPPRSSYRLGFMIRRTVKPCSRVGWSGPAWQIDNSSASVKGVPELESELIFCTITTYERTRSIFLAQSQEDTPPINAQPTLVGLHIVTVHVCAS